jgi:hypothetical protein
MQQPAVRQQQENTEVANTNIRNMDATVTELEIEMPNTLSTDRPIEKGY